MEGIHLLYLEINKIFSLSCQPICNSAKEEGVYKGRVPALQKEKLEQLKEALKNKTDDYTYTQMAKDFGITYMTLCRYRKKLEKELEAA